MTRKEIGELLSGSEYEFLRTHPLLGENICLLTFGGSRAYGTNLPTSDIDIRGFAMNSSKQFFQLEKDWEQVVETNTDTTIYSFLKITKLLLSCNPNTIEIFGCRPEDYIYVNKIGKILLENKTNFLSVRAIDSFGGYAHSQYNRLEHGLLGNGENDDKKLEMFKHSLECALNAFNAKHKSLSTNLEIKILDEKTHLEKLKASYEKRVKELNDTLEEELSKTTDESKIQSLTDLHKNDLLKLAEKYEKDVLSVDDAIESRIVLTGSFCEYPMGEIQSLLREFNQIKQEYGNINKRNTKKTDVKLAKHMMHLIRLYLMGIDLNERAEIVTYREKEHDMLMDIRNGKYMYGEGMKVRPEFYDLLHEIQKRYEYSVAHTILPEEPNYDALNEMLLKVYRESFGK